MTRGHLGQPWRLELIETQCGAVDYVIPVQHAHPDGVGDPRMQCDGLRSSCGVQGPHLWTIPRSIATIFGWVGSTEALGVRQTPATSAGRGSVTVSVGARWCCTPFCGAVHDVRGSPSAAAYAEPWMSIRSASPLPRAVPGAAIRSASLGL